MPMYSYRCEACGHDFEELVAMDRRDEVVCPKCGGQVRRSWEGACTFGITFSRKKAVCESACASSCGCSGACKCGR